MLAVIGFSLSLPLACFLISMKLITAFKETGLRYSKLVHYNFRLHAERICLADFQIETRLKYTELQGSVHSLNVMLKTSENFRGPFCT